MRRLWVISLCCAATAVLAVPLVAAANTTTRVAAFLTDVGKPGRTRLRIDVNGQSAYNALVHSSACGRECAIAAVTPGRSALRVLDLESDARPDVVLGLYSGGAHCCFIDQVFRPAPAGAGYVKVEHNFLDSGALLTKLGGHWAFLSADARIAEWGFTDFAHSGAPLQIFRVQGTRFTDVTRQYPARIGRDAARWLGAFRRDHANGVGFFAAWAADEYLLGHRSLVSSTVAADAGRHLLNSSFAHESGAAFVRSLSRALRTLGYDR